MKYHQRDIREKVSIAIDIGKHIPAAFILRELQYPRETGTQAISTDMLTKRIKR